MSFSTAGEMGAANELTQTDQNIKGTLSTTELRVTVFTSLLMAMFTTVIGKMAYFKARESELTQTDLS